MKSEIESLDKVFTKTLDKTEASLKLDGNTIQEALVSQMPLEMAWHTLVAQGKALKERCEYEAETLYAQAIQNELKNSYRSTSISEAREFAKCDPAYKEAKLNALDATALYDDIKSAVETVTSRRYILNNMSNIIVAGVDKHVI